MSSNSNESHADKIRKIFKNAQLNDPSQFKYKAKKVVEAFTEQAEKGNDVLYITYRHNLNDVIPIKENVRKKFFRFLESPEYGFKVIDHTIGYTLSNDSYEIRLGNHKEYGSINAKK